MPKEINNISLYTNVRALESYLKIGFVQTVLDENIAWDCKGKTPSLNIREIAEEKIWSEIKKGFNDLSNHAATPNVVVLPELTIPHGYIEGLKKLCKSIGAVVIAGIDFKRVKPNEVKNRAIVLVPSTWPDDNKFKKPRISYFYFGKSFISKEEEDFFNKLKLNFIPDPVTYILDAGQFGKIGVAICSDFFDIERFVIYRGQIHHLIVIAHNQDTNSFYFLAEAISRLVYCNVIICNTGTYGDSLAFAPYKEAHDRIIYRHKGNDLFSTQVVKLPVADLDNAQRGRDKKNKFKAYPPGYNKL